MVSGSFQLKRETGVGELGVGPKRKTGSALGAEVWPGEFSVENYAWHRRAGYIFERSRPMSFCISANEALAAAFLA